MSTHTAHAENPKAETLKYVATLVTLLILTAITVGASYINFGSGNVVIALFIATIKGIIVALIFMHLLHDKPVNAVIAVAGFVFLGIFLLFDFLDVGSRTNPQPINFHPLPTDVAPATAGALWPQPALLQRHSAPPAADGKKQ